MNVTKHPGAFIINGNLVQLPVKTMYKFGQQLFLKM